jgi:hypothetical protein
MHVIKVRPDRLTSVSLQSVVIGPALVVNCSCSSSSLIPLHIFQSLIFKGVFCGTFFVEKQRRDRRDLRAQGLVGWVTYPQILLLCHQALWQGLDDVLYLDEGKSDTMRAAKITFPPLTYQ